jgi:hypothetical protein
MMPLSVLFLDKASYTPVIVPDLSYRVRTFEKRSVGGCWDAEIMVSGDSNAVQQLVALVRHGVRLVDEHNYTVWQGMVNEVVFKTGKVSFGVSLDHMSNRIAVAYTDETGTRKTTTWAEDADSVAEFGTKELLASMNNVSAAAATSRRDAALTGDKRISRPRGVSSGGGGAGSDVSAIIKCIGWFRTLAWKYYADARGVESYEENGSGIQSFGEGTDINRVAQTFALAAGVPSFAVDRVGLWLYKVGAPTDDVIVEIYSGSTLGSGTLLASATFPAASLTDNSQAKVEAALSAAVTLDTSTRYIQIRRSGANDIGNYYRVNVNEEKGYTRGAMQVRVVTTWQNGIPNDGDLMFSLTGTIATTTLISDVAIAAGQFLSGVDIETASGVLTNPKNDGDSRALDVINTLLEAGTSAGRWLLAEVTPERRLRIYQAPEPSEAQYYLDGDHQMTDAYGVMVPATRAPVGVWAKLRGVFPALENSTFLAAGNNELIDRIEYTADYDDEGNVKSEKVRYTPRNAKHPFDVGGFSEG